MLACVHLFFTFFFFFCCGGGGGGGGAVEGEGEVGEMTTHTA